MLIDFMSCGFRSTDDSSNSAAVLVQSQFHPASYWSVGDRRKSTLPRTFANDAKRSVISHLQASMRLSCWDSAGARP